MKKGFIIGVQDLNKDQEQLLINYLTENGCGWWHWIDNFWLATDLNGKLEAKIIRNKIEEISGRTARSFVFEVEPSTKWGGFGPNVEPDNNMFKWLHENWL